MGKQINYYMEHESFVCIAEKAVEMGCEIIRDEKKKEVIRGFSAELVTEDCKRYYFYVPEAGEIAIKTLDGRSWVDSSYNASGNALIEAEYSYISEEKNRISRARLYCITGYYDDNGELIKRPECVTKIYEALVRYVKKLAPYTELTEIRNGTGEGLQYKHKEYITEHCLKLKDSGYGLG